MADHDLDLQSLHRHHEPDPAFRVALRAQVSDALITPTTTQHGGDITMLIEDDRTDATGAAPAQRRYRRGPIVFAGAAAIVALLATVIIAAGRDGGGEEAFDIADATPMYDDGFDAPGAWPVQPVPGAEITTGGGTQVIHLSRGVVQILRAPDFGDPFADMVVRADVVSVSEGATVAVQCRKDPLNGEGNFYAFRLGVNGAEIAMNGGGRTEVLAADETATLPTRPFSLSISCVDVKGGVDVRAFVDDREVLATTHEGTPVADGVAALEVIAGSAADAEVVFDRIVASRPLEAG